MKTLTAWLLVCALCTAGEIPVAQRVPNNDVGVCWFCCAETLGNVIGLPTLIGLRDRVMATQDGIGGAKEEVIERWLAAAQVTRHKTTKADYEFLKQGLKVSPGVIVTLKAWQEDSGPTETHAVIVTEMQWTGKEWQYKFVDPNKIEQNYTVGQKWFASHWVGYASYFDKADQMPHALQPPEVQFAESGIKIPYLPPATAPSPR